MYKWRHHSRHFVQMFFEPLFTFVSVLERCSLQARLLVYAENTRTNSLSLFHTQLRAVLMRGEQWVKVDGATHGNAMNYVERGSFADVLHVRPCNVRKS